MPRFFEGYDKRGVLYGFINILNNGSLYSFNDKIYDSLQYEKGKTKVNHRQLSKIEYVNA